MPFFSPSASVRPRRELSLAIVEGEGALRGTIANQIMPDFPINYRTAHMVKATLAGTQGLRHIAEDKYLRAPGTNYERIVATLTDATMTVQPRGVEIVVPNETKLDYGDYLDIESFYATKFGTEVTALTKEVLVANALLSTATFGSATNSLAAYTAANATYAAYVAGTGISFFADVINATRRGKARGEIYDTLEMSGPTFERVRQAVTVQAYAVGSLAAGQEATRGMIEAALKEFGITKLVIGDCYYNGAADGATPSLVQVWSNTYMWIGKSGTPGTQSEEKGISVPTIAGVGVLAFWEGFSPGGAPTSEIEAISMDGGNYVESYYQREIDSVVIRVKMSSLPFIGNTKCGELIATQFA